MSLKNHNNADSKRFLIQNDGSQKERKQPCVSLGILLSGCSVSQQQQTRACSTLTEVSLASFYVIYNVYCVCLYVTNICSPCANIRHPNYILQFPKHLKQSNRVMALQKYPLLTPLHLMLNLHRHLHSKSMAYLRDTGLEARI